MRKYTYIIFFITLIFLFAGCGASDVEETTADINDNDTELNEEENNDPEDETQNDENENTNTNDQPDNEQNNDSDNEQNENQSTNDEQNATSLHELTVHYIDVGQADATLFQYADDNDSYTLLFDTGDWNRNDVINYLANQDITTIDLIVTSHPHADHIGQLAEIVNTYEVDEVWMSGNEASSNTYIEAAEAVLDSNANYHEPRTGEEFSIGPMDISVLYPEQVTGDLNDESVSLHMSYGEVDFVFTGDAEKNAEAAMVQSGMNLDADILQLGHHGSRTSSTPQFIEAVNPDVAIYSAAVDSQYGHPDAEVVDRIQNAGIDLYGTDVNGTVIVTTDGKSYDITTKEDGTVSPDSTGSTSNGNSNQAQSDNSQETQNESEAVDGCVDINSASVEDVQAIIHIGPARADDLIDLRPFDSIDDLTKINGIGPARIDDIQAEGIACVN